MGSLAASQLQGLRFDPELGLLYVLYACPPPCLHGFPPASQKLARTQIGLQIPAIAKS